MTVVVPSVWTADRRSQFEVEEGSLVEVLQRFVAQRPDCRGRVMAPDGQPFAFINVSVDDRLVPRHDRATTVVPTGSTVILIAPMAGG